MTDTRLPVISVCGDWTLHEHQLVGSTNLLAANLPAWTAIRADTQTAGRGRFQRTWISDLGGLWLSAVVPLAQQDLARRALPLAAGLAVCNALQELGVRGYRLRWPNDVMVKDRKLAGLLIDQFSPGVAVIGIGLNVNNQPEVLDITLRNTTTRLKDLVAKAPGPPALTGLILRHLRRVVSQLDTDGTPELLLRINELWGPPRVVELDLDGRFRRGLFSGLDAQVRLQLSDEAGRLSVYEAHQVRHLTEI